MTILDWINKNSVIVNAASIIIGVMIICTAIMITYRVISPKIKKEKYHWVEAFIQGFYSPLLIYVIFSGLLLLVELLTKLNIFGSNIELSVFRSAGLLIILIWAGLKFARNIEVTLVSQTTDRARIATVRAISQLSRVVLIVIAALTGMQVLGIPISALLTFGGIGTVVIGFAAKDSLANLLGGLMIFVDRPFAVGDWIRSPDHSIEGTVEHIGWRLTRIRTFDKRPLYFPNGLFSTMSIENASRMTNRRIKTTIGLRYDDTKVIGSVISDIRKMLTEHPAIDTSKTLLVNLVEMGESSLNILIYTFTKTTNWAEFQDIQQEVFLKILDIIEQNGAECAFPTRTLFMQPDNANNADNALPDGVN